MKKLTILSANPKDTPRLRLDEEVREIKEGLKRSKMRDEFCIEEHEAVRMRDLRRAMLDDEPHLVHFSGHGASDGIMLEDEIGHATFVSPRALATLFELFKDTIVCVFLNSCFSDDQAAAISEHIPYVIGIPSSIPDNVAIEFAIGFYDAMGAGRSIEDAFGFGMSAINAERSFPEQSTPILRVRSNKYLPKEPLQHEETERALERLIQFAKNNGQPGNWAGFNRLAAEIGSLLWAVRQAYDLQQWPRVLEFRQLLGDFLYWRGFWNEGIEIGDLSFNAARNLGDQRCMAWTALYPLARITFYQGDHGKSASWSQTSLDLFQKIGDAYGEAAAYRYLGRACQAQHDLDKADECYQKGYEKASQFNATDSQHNLQGHLLAAIASIQFERGHYRDAQRNLEKALMLYQSTGDLPGIGEMQHQLGKVACELANYNAAETLLENSIKSIGIINSRQVEAEIFLSQADLYNRMGDKQAAVDKLNSALQAFENLRFIDGTERAHALLDKINTSIDI